MIEVTRKDNKESLENLIRRFNKKVQQSGVIIAARKNQYFEKPLGRRERRAKAIVRNQRRQEKIKQIRLGRR
jgi:ribosomal protein S21